VRKEILTKPIIKEIKARLDFLLNVGLDYITLERNAKTLSGGEAQRIRLATQIGSQLTGVLYILDEPTVGLHFADVQALLNILNRLVETGNTVILIEHNLDIIKAADWIVDLGPEGGMGGKSFEASEDMSIEGSIHENS
jgi:excinuclease ABC subunit A